MTLFRRICGVTLTLAWLAALTASGVHQIEEARYFCAEHEAFHHGEIATADLLASQWRSESSEKERHADCDVCTLRSREQAVPVAVIVSIAADVPFVDQPVSKAPAPDHRETLVHLAPKHSPPTLSI